MGQNSSPPNHTRDVASSSRHMASVVNETLNALPSRADRPDADITIIFDGECAFCRKQVTRLDRWDTQGRIAYISLHDDEVYRKWPQISREALMEAMCLVDASGKFHWGPDVFRYLSRQLPGLWWLAPIMHIPFTRRLQRTVYRWIAKKRYQLSGADSCSSDSCEMHFRS